MNNIEQYNAIRAAISSNLNTIKSLLDQANGLHKIVTELDGNVDSDERTKLTNSINSIYKSIDLLVIQTDSLLKIFIEYARSTEGMNV